MFPTYCSQSPLHWIHQHETSWDINSLVLLGYVLSDLFQYLGKITIIRISLSLIHEIWSRNQSLYIAWCSPITFFEKWNYFFMYTLLESSNKYNTCIHLLFHNVCQNTGNWGMLSDRQSSSHNNSGCSVTLPHKTSYSEYWSYFQIFLFQSVKKKHEIALSLSNN